jgi:hypothetical protein
MGLCLDFHRTKREKSGGQKQAKCARQLSVLDLVRTSTNADKRTDFFERGAGCGEHGVTIGTDWAEMRIAENAWFGFATAAKRAEFRFRVHGGDWRAKPFALTLRCSRRVG